MDVIHPQELEFLERENSYRSIEYTPHIGIEFPDVNLVDWLKAPNSDEILYELALLIAERSVVFFRSQTQLNSELQKDLIRRLGQLSGRSRQNGLYRHPLSQVLGEIDPEISVSTETITRVMCSNATSRRSLPKALKWIPVISHINWTELIDRMEACWFTSSAVRRIAQALDWFKPTISASESPRKRQLSGKLWHSDGIYEMDPPDFSSLKLMEPPKNSEDTIWASGYGLYDRLPGKAKLLLESLTATYSQPVLNRVARAKNTTIFEGPRGSPNNIGTALEAIHPMVRTHPVTGWKSVYTVGTGFMRYGKESDIGYLLDMVTVNEVSPEEGALVLDKLMSLITKHRDLQARFQWKNPSDMGEKPFLNPNSPSRAEALAKRQAEEKQLFDNYALSHGLAAACFN
ncbi:MAG: hypothetical protein MMC33_005987 [Icmadophila ericetorum]|nr:hypothetical protein [Icmadophila ericetorum]